MAFIKRIGTYTDYIIVEAYGMKSSTKMVFTTDYYSIFYR